MKSEKQKNDAEEQKIGLLMTDIIKMCMESGLSPFDSVFALGMATQGVMKLWIGPEKEPTDEETQVAIKVFKRGFSQRIEMLRGTSGETVEFGGIHKVRTH